MPEPGAGGANGRGGRGRGTASNDSDADSVMGPREGDNGKRVEVQMPRSLPELQQAARKYFGNHEGRGFKLKLHKHGVRAIKQHQHVRSLQDADVVVVSWDGDEGGVKQPLVTTHRADFIEHPVEAWTSPPVNSTPRTPIPFEAETSYARDYTNRPQSVQQQRRPPSRTPFDGDPFTAKSTYAEHYPGHPTGNHRVGTPAAMRQRPLPKTKFNAETSYTHDYIRHPHEKHHLAGPPSNDNGIPDRPFEGVTTYTEHYPGRKGTPQHGRRRPDAQQLGPQPPFQGNSEYQQRYQEYPLTERGVRIYLEPNQRGIGTLRDGRALQAWAAA